MSKSIHLGLSTRFPLVNSSGVLIKALKGMTYTGSTETPLQETKRNNTYVQHHSCYAPNHSKLLSEPKKRRLTQKVINRGRPRYVSLKQQAQKQKSHMTNIDLSLSSTHLIARLVTCLHTKCRLFTTNKIGNSWSFIRNTKL